jgi:hypothetical protein
MTENDQPAPMSAPMGSPATAGPAGNPPEAPDDGPREGAYDEPAKTRSGQLPSAGGARRDEAAQVGTVGGGLDDLGPPLFEAVRSKEVTQRWHEIQAAFVDDPRGALRQAGELNDEVVSSLTIALDERKQTLEQVTAGGDTEQLRIGLRQYRQMLDHILAL